MISMMTISLVSEDLNGSEVSCVDTLASESARTTIFIVGGRLSCECASHYQQKSSFLDTPLVTPNVLPHSEP